jgi:hypothetical protein
MYVGFLFPHCNLGCLLTIFISDLGSMQFRSHCYFSISVSCILTFVLTLSLSLTFFLLDYTFAGEEFGLTTSGPRSLFVL